MEPLEAAGGVVVARTTDFAAFAPAGSAWARQTPAGSAATTVVVVAATTVTAATVFTPALPTRNPLIAVMSPPRSSARSARAAPSRSGVLQRRGERATRAEDDRLGCALRQAQSIGDLAVGEPLPFAQQDGAPLLLRQAAECGRESDEVVGRTVGRGDGLLEDRDVLDVLQAIPSPRGAEAGEADVLGDSQEPGRAHRRANACIETPACVQVRGLQGVLGLLR